MPIKSDRWITDQSEKGMIKPFAKKQVKEIELPEGTIRRVISFGVSSYGYDMRLGNMFRVLRANQSGELDPKNVQAGHFQTVQADNYLLLPPQGLALAQTLEYFTIPRGVLTICYGKSTYARCGVLVNVTPFEPEWEGHATIAISNMSALPVRIYANEGIAQLIFLESDEICNTSYKDKGGKYQAQKEPTPARV